MKKATISEEKRSQAHGEHITPRNAPTKISRALVTLLQRSLNRFEAEALGDHCLHSTISKLSNDYGLKFVRESERVPNNWGTPCRVIRYSLPASERKRAQALLKLLCSAAGAKREAE